MNLVKSFLFVEALSDSFLHQHITQPTSVRHGWEPSILDLVLTNEEGIIENIDYRNPLGKSDHLVLTFEFKCCTKKEYKRQECTNLCKRQIRPNGGRA